MKNSTLFFLLFSFFTSTVFAALPPPYDSVKEIRPFVDHGWYSNATQLHKLIDEHKIKTIVEVGSWLGKSTIDLARKLPSDGKIYAIDHWKGSEEHQVNHSAWHPSLPYLYEQFLSNIIHTHLTHKVIPLRMSSLAAAGKLNVQPDLIYLDADHSTKAVYLDILAWFPHVQGRGILCGDDWTWRSVRRAVTKFARDNHFSVESSGNFWRIVE